MDLELILQDRAITRGTLPLTPNGRFLLAMPDVVGDPTTDITIDGCAYTFSELRMGDMGQLQKFINTRPRPQTLVQDFSGVAEAVIPPPEALALLKPEEQARLIQNATGEVARMVERQLREIRLATEVWPPSIGSPEAMNILLTEEEGRRELFRCMMRHHHHDEPREEVDRLFGAITLRAWNRLFEVAFAIPAEPAPEADPTVAAGGETAGTRP